MVENISCNAYALRKPQLNPLLGNVLDEMCALNMGIDQ